MFFKTLLVDTITLFVYVALAILIWEVLTRRFLIEKLFNLILVFVYLAYALLLAGLEFLSFVILLLYVGAIAVLFLFVVMILNPDYHLVIEEQKALQANIDAQKAKEKNEMTWLDWLQHFVMAFLTAGFCTSILLVKVVVPFLRRPNPDGVKLADLYLKIKYEPWTIYKENMKLSEVGDVLYNKYGIAVLVIGGALIVAMIGSIMLCTYQTVKLKRQNISKQSKRYK